MLKASFHLPRHLFSSSFSSGQRWVSECEVWCEMERSAHVYVRAYTLTVRLLFHPMLLIWFNSLLSKRTNMNGAYFLVMYCAIIEVHCSMQTVVQNGTMKHQYIISQRDPKTYFICKIHNRQGELHLDSTVHCTCRCSYV